MHETELPGVATTEIERPIARPLVWPVCRAILGIVLLAAAALKAEELASLPMLGFGFLNQRWFLVCVIEIETVFGGMLLLGAGGFWTWLATLILWLTFLSTAGYEAFSGADSCGCFGRVQVSPWYMATFDLVVVLALLFCRPNRHQLRNTPRRSTLRWAAVGSVAIAGAAFGAWNLNRYSPSRLSQDGLSTVDGTVILEPRKWVGHPFLLAKYIDIGPKLEHGDWIVLLYRYDCEHCQRAVPKYEAFAKQNHTLSETGLALIEIPPLAPPDHGLSNPSTFVIAGRLDTGRDWFASTPVSVTIRNDIVVSVAEGDAAENVPSKF